MVFGHGKHVPIRGRDHLTLFGAVWVVWSLVFLVLAVPLGIFSVAYPTIAGLCASAILLIYPIGTAWYWSQAMREARRLGDRGRAIRRAGWSVLAVAVGCWLAANCVVDDSHIAWDYGADSALFEPPWVYSQFSRWGWPFVFVRVFDEPLRDVGTWHVEATTLTLNIAVLSFMVWWVAAGVFADSARVRWRESRVAQSPLPGLGD